MSPTSSSNNVGNTSAIKILANIFISFIGAGILGLPYAFKEAGIIEGIIVMVSVAVISVKAMMMVVDCKYHIENVLLAQSPKNKPHRIATDLNAPLLVEESSDDSDIKSSPIKIVPQVQTYGDIGFYAMGNTGRALVDYSVIISQIGFCCAYLIFIMENGASYIPMLSRLHWLIILLPPLYLLVLPRHLSKLAIFSIFAQISSIFAFAVVFWFDFQHYHVARFNPKEFSIQGLPFYFAVAIYCFEGAGMILSLEQSVAPKVRHRFKHYFISSMFAVTFLYIAFGVSGYLSFGPETSDIITFNLPKGPSGAFDFPSLVTCCLCVSLFLTYPIMMFPVLELLEARYIISEGLLKGNLLRLFLVLLTGMIVIVVPNFGTLMALIGSSCCTLLAFILPGIFHNKLFKGSYTSIMQKSFNMFLIWLGVIGTVVGLLDAFKRMGPHVLHQHTTEYPPVV
ncbi:uncharacterized protein LOC132201441 [Neocloeon triangulifer]|uniref:uncharacterized protein LOC132201441 n=1 Tax=Neocloeon triangulifer TaxID=2078957 RepID=UPI00286EE1C4|nr:uncharacterized protein LOC132201441 [Neocloeon triangulifer]